MPSRRGKRKTRSPPLDLKGKKPRVIDPDPNEPKKAGEGSRAESQDSGGELDLSPEELLKAVRDYKNKKLQT